MREVLACAPFRPEGPRSEGTESRSMEGLTALRSTWEASVVPEIGTVLKERYVIHSVLGQGGMGAVYLALDRTLGGKRVAVKEMAINFHTRNERDKAIEQFRQEAMLLASLEHPRLVSVTDFFENGENAYLVMALVEGRTLDAIAAARPVPIDEMLAWIVQICEVLEYLHGHQPPVLFRDMKPSNVMLDTHGGIRLIDFGIARTFEAGQSTSTFLKGAGTAGFSPVEQFGGLGTDARSDIYSLGATMFSLLTGEVPPISVDVMYGGVKAAAPRSLNAAISTRLEQIILKAMALRPEDRYQTVRDLHDALRDTIQAGATQDASAQDQATVLPSHGASGAPLPTQAPQVSTPVQQASARTVPVQWMSGATSVTKRGARRKRMPMLIVALILVAIFSGRWHSTKPPRTPETSPPTLAQTPVEPLSSAHPIAPQPTRTSVAANQTRGPYNDAATASDEMQTKNLEALDAIRNYPERKRLFLGLMRRDLARRGVPDIDDKMQKVDAIMTGARIMSEDEYKEQRENLATAITYTLNPPK